MAEDLTPHQPIFIHSLFRSGSTYMYETFRRSSAHYWGYQEPFHEHILELDPDRDGDMELSRKSSATLRHRQPDKPYFSEYLENAKEISAAFKKAFSYDDFFLEEYAENTELKSYLRLLIDSAKGRPVLQFCRSAGRIGWLRQHFQATHIFLWRNPWDQWWSYKVTPYFDITNLLILNSPSAPPAILAIREHISLQTFHHEDINEEMRHFSAISLTKDQSYFVFFALWVVAYVEGNKFTDCMINMDQLCLSEDYRCSVLSRLAILGVSGVCFDDCKIPSSCFSASEFEFFLKIQNMVFAMLSAQGYCADEFEQVNEALALSAETSSRRAHSTADLLAELQRCREMRLTSETALANTSFQLRETIEMAKTIESALKDARHDLDMIRKSYFCRVYRVVRKYIDGFRAKF